MALKRLISRYSGIILPASKKRGRAVEIRAYNGFFPNW
ncbi:hypothetical protein DHBDCA_p2836 [Dehalobacter sp. DCA]|nr:hypothetical protein DHBDCA_p2836 [Dehalobacter sp. DCA]